MKGSLITHILSKSLIALAVYPLLSSFLNARPFFQEGGDISHHGHLMEVPIPLTQEDHIQGSSLVNQHALRTLCLNYLLFMLYMLTLDRILEFIFQSLQRLKQAQRHVSLEESNWRQEIRRAGIIYTVIYCFCQIMIGNIFLCSLITGNSSVCMAQTELLKDGHQYRLLEEVEPINFDNEQPERIALSLGKAVSSLNIGANHMVVTKDLKYAFAAVGTSGGGLKVIDISNLAAPNVVKTLGLTYNSNFGRQRFLYLSPDEKTLFISCFEHLEIIDITNPESASYLGKVLDDRYIKALQIGDQIRLSLSFALSADSRTLFIGGLGLQTFDISDLEKPILLSSQFIVPKMGSYFLLAVAATADRKTLFIANGTFDSFDISDARNMRLINSFSDPDISMNSIVLSHDNKIAFGLSTIGTEKIQITKLNVTNPTSPTKTQSFVFAQTSIHPAWIMALSQKERYLFITTDQGFLDFQTVVFDLMENRVLSSDQSVLAKIMTLTALPRENYILASNGSKTMILEFYHNYPNKEILSLTDYRMWKIKMTKQLNHIDFSPDERFLFVVGYDKSENSWSLLEIYDFQNKTSSNLVSSLEIKVQVSQITISRDLSRAVLMTQSKIVFLDFSNLTTPSVLSEYSMKGGYTDFEQVAVWAGSDIIFVLANTFRGSGNLQELKIMDFSDSKLPKDVSKLDWNIGEEQSYKMNVYQEKNLLIMTGPTLEIYNISDVLNLQQIGLIDVATEKTEYVNFAKASHDFKTFFIETIDRSSFHKLKIYDISDLKNPRFVSELILNTKYFSSLTSLLSGDSKTIYLLQEKYILAIDVSHRKAPRIFGLLPLSDVYQENITQIKLSNDNRKMYLVTKNGTVHSMDLGVPQTIYLNQEEFYIGQQYSDHPLVLRLDEGSEYTLMQGSEYKISKIGIFEVKVDATADYATPSLMFLPSWAKFDETNKLLTIEPRKQADLGSYTLYATIFNKVSASAFSFLDSNQSNALLTELVFQGYLDKQHFLTSVIGSLEEFYLLPSSYDGKKKQIYDVLNGAYVVTCTTIHILPSLKIDQADKLSIVSPNTNSIKIYIQLQNTTRAKFLNRPYGSLFPAISNNKSHLMIEGSLKEVNAALKNVTVDLENIETCDAEMTVTDDMNPSVTVNLSDIKNYFRRNQAPYLNPKKSIQKQIDMVPVSTGQYFTITLDRDTILDDDNRDNLNYKLVSKAGQANDTIPSWLSFEGLTIRGTAPEELFDRDIEFVLIASNEFKKVEVPFKLHLTISWAFIAKLIMRYSPYILTMIGLYIKANKIYNILGKKYYRHKKDFYVEIGKEITSEIIFPIAFNQQEKKESEIIWEYLRKRISQDEMSNLLDESTDSKEKVLKLIKEIVDNSIPKERKKNLKVFFRGVNSRKKILNQLIINKMVDLQLHSKEEKSTKKAYEKVKDHWPELVEWNSTSGSFKTNTNKLYAKLIEASVDIRRDSMEESLLSKPKELGVNLYLLSCALEAHTLDCHTLERLAIRSDIQIKEKTEKNCLQSFFKFDIETMNMNSQLQVNYGISCKFENDSLVFSGVPCENFRDRTLVVEIANRQHKILKEIWIHEKNIGSCVNVDVKTEEQHYEVL